MAVRSGNAPLVKYLTAHNVKLNVDLPVLSFFIFVFILIVIFVLFFIDHFHFFLLIFDYFNIYFIIHVLHYVYFLGKTIPFSSFG